MINNSTITAALLMVFSLGFSISTSAQKPQVADTNIPESNVVEANSEGMKLGAFSVSLSVKDLQVSKAFYENLGFTVFGGDLKHNYLIMKNETTMIGLFQGMFRGNMLTFNPGWDGNAQNLEEFDDIREIHKHLKESGVEVTPGEVENPSGPASFVITDPDGNVLLFDQHR